MATINDQLAEVSRLRNEGRKLEAEASLNAAQAAVYDELINRDIRDPMGDKARIERDWALHQADLHRRKSQRLYKRADKIMRKVKRHA